MSRPRQPYDRHAAPEPCIRCDDPAVPDGWLLCRPCAELVARDRTELAADRQIPTGARPRAI